MIFLDHYWIELDPDGNPTGHVCHGHYGISDKPMEGFWIFVKQVEITDKDKD